MVGGGVESVGVCHHFESLMGMKKVKGRVGGWVSIEVNGWMSENMGGLVNGLKRR